MLKCLKKKQKQLVCVCLTLYLPERRKKTTPLPCLALTCPLLAPACSKDCAAAPGAVVCLAPTSAIFESSRPSLLLGSAFPGYVPLPSTALPPSEQVWVSFPSRSEAGTKLVGNKGLRG